MNIAGKLRIPQFNARFDKPLVNTYSTSDYYVRLWGLEKYVSEVKGEITVFSKRGENFSGNTREARHWTYDPNSRTYAVEHKGNNHLKTGECPEAAPVWKGSGGIFPEKAKRPVLI
jgi:hypothetical protein